jgi:uncharacterized protein (TIGR00251 family)
MDSARVRLRVSPGADRTGLVGRHGDGWKVRVAAPPENGRANAAVVQLIASTLSVPKEAVTVVSGRSGRDKIIELAGIDADQVDARLDAAARKEPQRA